MKDTLESIRVAINTLREDHDWDGEQHATCDTWKGCYVCTVRIHLERAEGAALEAMSDGGMK